MAMEGPAGMAGMDGFGGGDPRFAAFFRYFKDGALPLRITVGQKAGHPTLFLATRVERKALPDALFQPPAGYTSAQGPTRRP